MDRLPLTGAGVHALALFDDPPAGSDDADRSTWALPGFPPAGRGWLGSAVGPTPEERLARLVRTIEADIIPRLVRAHADAPRRLPTGDGPDPTAEAAEGRLALCAVDPGLDAGAFAALVLTADDETLFAGIDRLVASGCAIESLYADLIAPTARHLGLMWADDRCNFADVTIATGRLQQILRRLSPAFGQAVQAPPDGRRVLLVPAPGEQHTLGLSMVADYFVRAGWQVLPGGALALDDAGRPSARDAACSDVLRCVQREWLDVVGFSLGSVRGLVPLQRVIDRVRRASRNRAVGILVGGPLFAEDASLVARVGADATAVAGADAPAVAERLLADRARRLRHA